MRIADIRWRNYRLPFQNSFSTAHGVTTAREGIIVQVTTERGVSGIGEIAPLLAFGARSLADVGRLLPALAARLSGKTLYEALDLVHNEGKAGTKAASAVSAPVRCGLETALLDAIGKAEGCGVCALLSPAGFAPRAAVPVNAVIGASTTEAAIAAALDARNNGYRCVKLKVGWGVSAREEIERVEAVRDAIGSAMHLRLDANEAWNLEEAIAILTQCVPYDIQYVEQPLKAHDLAGMRTLRQAVDIPIAVDEALSSRESAQLVIDSEAADILVIKPQLAGGLRVGQQMIQSAAARGVRAVITSAIEAGIGLVAALHLAAASPAVTLECGLATLHLLSDDLLIDDLPVRDGFLTVPTDPGLGVALDREALDRYSF
ncbi:MAG TPA: o-succinylbenzoate synthase [Ktedonobacteraceae bacterium]|nr:o-succinylbenzoate synthase [Ktedonobacteraceae bacterium]